MPFTKVTSGKNKGKYTSPSGRVFTKKQVVAYYASSGFTKPVPKKGKKKTTKKKKKAKAKRGKKK